MQSPSKNSTTPEKEGTPPSSPPQPTTTSPSDTVPATPSPKASPASCGAASGGGGRLPWQVMELTSGGGGSAGGGGSSAVTVAAAVPVMGVLVEKAMEKRGVGEEVGSSSKKGKQKRKGYELKDPPSGNPKCPECGREFASWKSVFGHLRIHSGRSYTGLYPPPVSPPRQPPQGDNGDQEASKVKASGEDEGNSATKVLGFDLNMPMEGSSATEASSNADKNIDDNEEDSAAKFEFDLNQLPAAEEDEDNIGDKKQP